MKKSDFIEKDFHLTPIIGKDKATHRERGHLDIMWTNIDFTSANLIENLDSISDHALLTVTLRIGS